MNHFEKDEIQILSETRLQQSEDLVDSNFQRNISRTQSASISIPMASLDRYEREPNLVGHIAPLHTFYISLYGIAKGFGRKLFSLCSSCIPGVMNPQAELIQQWNKFLAMICLVAIIVDPLFFFLIYVKKDDKCIVVNWTMATTLVLIRSIFDVPYFLNILLQFRLAYISPGKRFLPAYDLVDDPKKIAINYMRGYFLVDLFDVLPLPQIMILIVLPNSLGSSGANFAIAMNVIFVQYILKFFRFLPLLSRIILETVWANLVVNLLRFMLAGHIVGSCWYLFGLQRVNQCLRDACHHSNLLGCMDLIDCDSKVGNVSATLWSEYKGAGACLDPTSGAFSYGIYANAIPLTIETKLINKYVYALFWGLQQIGTLAGNQTPSNFVWEVLFTTFIIVLGLFFLAILIGNMQNYFQSHGWRSLEMLQRGRDAEKWMSNRRLPEDLKRKVRQAQRYSWSTTGGVLEKMVLENLPEDLLTDIRRHLFKFIKRVPIFSVMDEDEPIILDAVHERLIQTTYMPGSRILRQGGLVQKMVFIVRGRLESIGEDGIPVWLSEGDACGEELLTWYLDQSSESREGKKVKLQEQGPISNRTVRCLTNVVAFLLGTKDMEEITTLIARFLHARYTSPYWRSLAANRIQIAWRYRKKRQSRGEANGVALATPKVTFYLYE